MLMNAGAAGVGMGYATSYDAFFVVDGGGIIRYRKTDGRPRWLPEEVGPVVDQAIARLLTATPDAPPREAFTLLPAYPNPFNPATRIRYRLERDSAVPLVDLRVLDLRGRLVRTLASGRQPGGAQYEVAWDGRDAAGVPVASGTYLVSLHVDGERQERFVTLVK